MTAQSALSRERVSIDALEPQVIEHKSTPQPVETATTAALPPRPSPPPLPVPSPAQHQEEAPVLQEAVTLSRDVDESSDKRRYRSPFPFERDDDLHQGYSRAELRKLYERRPPEKVKVKRPSIDKIVLLQPLYEKLCIVEAPEQATTCIGMIAGITQSKFAPDDKPWTLESARSFLESYGFAHEDGEIRLRHPLAWLALGYESFEDYIEAPQNHLEARQESPHKEASDGHEEVKAPIHGEAITEQADAPSNDLVESTTPVEDEDTAVSKLAQREELMRSRMYRSPFTEDPEHAERGYTYDDLYIKLHPTFPSSVRLILDPEESCDEIIEFLETIHDRLAGNVPYTRHMRKFTGSDLSPLGKPWTMQECVLFFKNYGFTYSAKSKTCSFLNRTQALAQRGYDSFEQYIQDPFNWLEAQDED